MFFYLIYKVFYQIVDFIILLVTNEVFQYVIFKKKSKQHEQILLGKIDCKGATLPWDFNLFFSFKNKYVDYVL